MQNWIRKEITTNSSIIKNSWTKQILKLVTLYKSTCLNMQRLREEHYEALNSTKDNGKRKTIEEIDELSKTREDIMFLHYM